MQVPEEEGCPFPAILSDSHPPSSTFCLSLSTVHRSRGSPQRELDTRRAPCSPGRGRQLPAPCPCPAPLELRSRPRGLPDPFASCSQDSRAARQPPLIQNAYSKIVRSPSLFAGKKLCSIGWPQLVSWGFNKHKNFQ